MQNAVACCSVLCTGVVCKTRFYLLTLLCTLDMATRRSAFFISDRTGITAEMLGHSLLTQFEQVEFSETTLPFIDTAERRRPR